jgi:hypothetical protein
MNSNSTPHTWRFFRAGGFDQVKLQTGADLMSLDQLDQKLWVALACPTQGLHFDAKTLEYIDTDKDGRIRATELIAAVKWAGGLLKNPDELAKKIGPLPLASINDATPEGKAILGAAQMILEKRGRKDANAITLEDTAETAKVLTQTSFNGDGVIVEDSADSDALKAVIKEIMDCLGSVADRSGKPGVNQAKVDQFFADAVAFSDWMKKSEGDKAMVPLGDATGAAAAAVQAAKAKVDDYFARCRLAAFDGRALAALNREEKEFLALAAKDLTITCAEIAGFPVARIEPGRALPLTGGVNPAWEGVLNRLQSDAVKPLLGDKASLTEAEWSQLQAKLGPFACWQAAKAGASVEKLGLTRVRAILASKAREELTALIAKDQAEEGKVNALTSVDKLIRFHRGLHLLCVNFVNFEDFYDRGEPAIFQAGTLYLDQRSCELVLPVQDAAKHATMAALAGTYLAYCDCTRKGTGEKMQIVAAFTGGDSDNLMVGRNGIFYDRQQRDWDATITKIIDNPISIRQAFWSPYKKLVRMIEEQVAKRAAAADAAATTKLETAAVAAATADKAKPVEPKKVDVGTVAALGVAFGALATAFAAMAGYVSGLLKLPFWQVCLAVAGLLLIVSGPSMVIAWLKLRKRNLGPILDSNGWALNAKARINVPFGGALTQVAALPPNSTMATTDKYGEVPSVWPKVLGFVVAVCFLYSLLNSHGLVYEWTGGKFGQSSEEVKKQQEDAKKELENASKKLGGSPPATNAPAQ